MNTRTRSILRKQAARVAISSRTRAALLALLVTAPLAQATTYYWDVDGANTSGFSSVAGAWDGSNQFWNTSSAGSVGGTVIAAPASSDDLIFAQPTTSSGTVTVSNVPSASSITFAANVGPATLTGSTITIGGTGASSGIFQQSSSANTIASDLVINSAKTAINVSNSGSGLLTLGAITGAAPSGTQTINVGGSGAGGVTFGGVIANVAGDASKVGLAVSTTGTGITTLSSASANTFTGGVAVNSGTLRLDYANYNGNNLVNSGNTLTLGGGTLSIQGNGTVSSVQTFNGTTLNAGLNNFTIAKGASATSVTANLGAVTVSPGSVTLLSPSSSTFWGTTASTTDVVRISAGNSVASLPSAGNTTFINAGVFIRQSAAAGLARWAAVDSTGQVVRPANASNLTATTGNSPTPTTAFQVATSSGGLTLTTSPSIYGLIFNFTSVGQTVNLANNGTLTLNGIIQQQAISGTLAAPNGGNVIIGSEKNLVINMDNGNGGSNGLVTISAPIANNGSSGGTGGNASSVTIGNTAPIVSPGSVFFTGANTYSGGTYLLNGVFVAQDPGTNNYIKALGTGAVTLRGGSLLFRAGVTAGTPQTIITGDGITGNDLIVAGSTSITVGIRGGATTATTGHTIRLNNLSIGSQTLTVSAGTYNNGAATVATGYGLQFAGATTLTGNPTFNVTAPLTLTGAVGDGGNGFGFTKSGAGTMTLSSASTYTGLTTISAGTLALGTSGTIAGNVNLGTSASRGTLGLTAKSNYTFGSTQAVTGDGTINIGAPNAVTLQGGLAPGNSGAGRISVTGGLVLGNAATVGNLTGAITTMELAGLTTAGTDYDQVAATGQLTFGGTLNVVSSAGFNLNQTGTYTLFTFGSETGSFDFVSVGGSSLSNSSGTWTGSSSGFGYTFTESLGTLEVSAIPEPGSFALLGGFAAIGFAGLRRRRAA